MAEVTASENENFESLLRRFNKKVQQTGILSELRRHEHYEKPGARRKRKRAVRRRGLVRAARR